MRETGQTPGSSPNRTKPPKARIVQLCTVPPGFVVDQENDEDLQILALALIEIEGPLGKGQEIWPVVAGYGDQSDLLRLEVPASADLDLFYEISYYGDHIDPPCVRRIDG